MTNPCAREKAESESCGVGEFGRAFLPVEGQCEKKHFVESERMVGSVYQDGKDSAASGSMCQNHSLLLTGGALCIGDMYKGGFSYESTEMNMWRKVCRDSSLHRGGENAS